MTKSKITCKLFKLKDINNLSDVNTKILNRSFADPLVIAKNDYKIAKLLSEEEKNFYFTWGEKSLPNKIKLEDIDGAEKSVEYLFVSADIEYAKRKKKDNSGNFLPKESRVNRIPITNYFYCMENSVYLIICTSNEFHLDRVKKLVGTHYLDKLDELYKMPSDLFNWLFYKYTQDNGVLNDGIRLMNINGFIGNIGDEHNIFKGTSDQTSELIITKAFISNGETLKTITARLRNNDIDIVFTIDDKSNTYIFVNQSEKLKILEVEDKTPFFVIYLYGFLIPKLKSLYNSSSELFLEKEKKQFSVKIGLEVIESIINHNYLGIDEVIALFDSQPNIKRTIQVK